MRPVLLFHAVSAIALLGYFSDGGAGTYPFGPYPEMTVREVDIAILVMLNCLAALFWSIMLIRRNLSVNRPLRPVKPGNTHHPYALLRDSDPETRCEVLRRYPMIAESFRTGDTANDFARRYPEIALYQFGYSATEID